MEEHPESNGSVGWFASGHKQENLRLFFENKNRRIFDCFFENKNNSITGDHDDINERRTSYCATFNCKFVFCVLMHRLDNERAKSGDEVMVTMMILLTASPTTLVRNNHLQVEHLHIAE